MLFHRRTGPAAVKKRCAYRFNSSRRGFNASALDYARFGLLYLHLGYVYWPLILQAMVDTLP